MMRKLLQLNIIFFMIVISCSSCITIAKLIVPQKEAPYMDIKIALLAEATDGAGNIRPVSYYPLAGRKDIVYVRKTSLLHCGGIKSGEVIHQKDGTIALKLKIMNTASIRWQGDSMMARNRGRLAFLVDDYLFAVIPIPVHNHDEETLLITGDWVDPELLQQVVDLIPENRKKAK